MHKKAIFPRLQIFKEITELTSEIPVEKIMARDLKTLAENDTVMDVVNLMAKNSLSSVIVIGSKGEPVGIVSTGDLIKKVFSQSKDPKKIRIKEIMSKSVEAITPQTTIGEASELMKDRGIRRLPVVDNKKKVVGMITSTDLVKETNRIYIENKKLLWNTGLLYFLFTIGGAILVLLAANLIVK